VYAREEARHIIKRACNATENDALIFCGTGATTSINLLISKLGIKKQVDHIKLRQQMAGILTAEQMQQFEHKE
jgi:selenocysteine lyase/cysteine desulfurase